MSELLKKPQPYYISVKRWRCNNEKHNHTMEHVAQKCIDQNIGVRNASKIRYKERDLWAAWSYFDGMTFNEIAETLNLSRDRVRQIVYRVLNISRKKHCMGLEPNDYWNNKRFRPEHADHFKERVISVAEFWNANIPKKPPVI